MVKVLLYLLYFVGFLFVVILLIIYFMQERLIFFPEKLAQDYIFKFQEPFEEVFIPSGDAQIHALHFKVNKPKGVILYFHGNAGSLRSWGTLAPDFTSKGYSLFIIDYRSFGKSTGRLSEKALHNDARAAYDYLLQLYRPQDIIIYGRSIGTGIATRLASEVELRMLLLETPYYNFAHVAKYHFSFLPVALLLKYTFRNDQWIEQVNAPIYIIHGTADEVVPYASGLKLAEKAGSRATMVTIKEGGHNNLSAFAQYHQLMEEILK
jgi:pimeloyl-ACP methyl ester carboxylesterase